MHVGHILQALGDLEGAKQLHELALTSSLKTYGEAHPEVATRLSNLAWVLKDLGDFDGAKQQAREALRVARLQPEGSQVRSQIENALSWTED